MVAMFGIARCGAVFVCDVACFKPLTCFRSSELTENGKRKMVFDVQHAVDDREYQIPCRQCIGCRLDKSREWALRCVHEAQMCESNSFITLTYDDEHLPDDFSLDKSHFQKFMKRLRKHLGGKRISYFHCGEYGPENLRPHYHACIFGHDFPDRELWSSKNDVNIYTSEVLTRLWPFGFTTVGDVTFESAAYVARYSMKKVNISDATPDDFENPYWRIDEETGEFYTVEPEYATMSRNPGIGKTWYEKYKDDVFPHDHVVLDGVKHPVPDFYLREYEKEDGVCFDFIKFEREQEGLLHADDNTYERLVAREKVKYAQLGQLKRNEV